MTRVLQLLFGAMALINLAPMVSAFIPSSLQALYGISPANSELLTLLQHRALLLGLVGSALAAAVIRPSLRWPSLIGAFISMGSFLGFVLVRGQMSGALGMIAIVDIVGMAFGVIALVIMIKKGISEFGWCACFSGVF